MEVMKPRKNGVLIFICLLQICHGAYPKKVFSLSSYHNYETMTSSIPLLKERYPGRVHFYSIGKSIEDRSLWVIAISASNPDKHNLLRPEVKYVGNMHGNEAVSREMMLHFAESLLEKYGEDDNVTRLLDNTRIHIMPSMNPDGFEKSVEGQCYGNVGRTNANGVDLNRNFPDHFESISTAIQQETKLVMDWIHSEHFVLSANFHGGALVASYPLDNLDPAKKSLYVNMLEDPSPYSACSDDDVFRFLALTYSASHGRMRIYNETTRYANFSAEYGFKDGVTNGADWYAVSGGMQDYNYFETGCFDVTMELGNCKYPLRDEIAEFWEENEKSLLQYLMQVHRGIKGIVTDIKDNSPIYNATVRVYERDLPQRTTVLGEFWLILLPGTYVIEIAKEGSKTELRTVTVSEELYQTQRLDIQLRNSSKMMVPSISVLLIVFHNIVTSCLFS